MQVQPPQFPKRSTSSMQEGRRGQQQVSSNLHVSFCLHSCPVQLKGTPLSASSAQRGSNRLGAPQWRCQLFSTSPRPVPHRYVEIIKMPKNESSIKKSPFPDVNGQCHLLGVEPPPRRVGTLHATAHSFTALASLVTTGLHSLYTNPRASCSAILCMLPPDVVLLPTRVHRPPQQRTRPCVGRPCRRRALPAAEAHGATPTAAPPPQSRLAGAPHIGAVRVGARTLC